MIDKIAALALALAAAGSAAAADTAAPDGQAARARPASAVPADEVPFECDMCDAWNATQAPFPLHDRSWYVGTRGLSAVVIDTGAGLILIDGGLPQSARPIAANLASIGFDVSDVKWIVNSHAHFDHAGGIAALQRMSGAMVAASPLGAAALRLGNVTPDDPQAGLGDDATRYPPVAEVRELADGEAIELGRVRLVAHHTPGHTPGGTSWSWRSCDGEDCIDIVYADSLTPVAAPDFRFTRAPAAVETFRRSIAKISALPCDLLVTTHPDAALFERAAKGEPLAVPGACGALAGRANRALDGRVQRESEVGPNDPI